MTKSAGNSSTQLECPQCGAVLVQINASSPDEAGPRRVEFRCANGHRISVERRETIADRDPAVLDQD